MALWSIASNNFHPGQTKLYTPNLRDPSSAEHPGPCVCCSVTLAIPTVVRPALVVTPNDHLEYYKAAILCDKCMKTHLLLFIMLARTNSIVDDRNVWAEVTGTSEMKYLIYQTTTNTSKFSFQQLISKRLSPAPPRYELVDVPGITENYSIPLPPSFNTEMASALWRRLPDTSAKQSSTYIGVVVDMLCCSAWFIFYVVCDLAMGCATNASMKALCVLELVNYGFVAAPIPATTASTVGEWIPSNSLMDEVD